MTDELDPQLVAGAIDILAGHQIIGFYEAYHLLGGTGDPDLMPVVMRHGLVRLLQTLGYNQRWAGTIDGDDLSLMWARGPWPADFALTGEKETWIAAYDVKK